MALRTEGSLKSFKNQYKDLELASGSVKRLTQEVYPQQT